MGLLIPMRRRLPNPPAVFVGRQSEVEQLRTNTQRAPVTFVVGPAGSGKSALIQFTFKHPSPQWGGPILVVGVHPEDPLEDALAVAHHVLTSEEDLPAPSSQDALLDNLLAAAERHEAFIIFEDLAGPFFEHPHVLSTLRVLAGHAVRSRWLITCTTAPNVPDLVEQIIVIPPLDANAARTLARQCGAGDAALDRIVADAAGSPLAIRQRAMNADSLEGVARISPDALELLTMLAQVRQPLSLQALEKVGVAIPDRDALETLQDAGWLQRDGDARQQLPEVLRQDLASVVRDSERTQTQERLATGLAELDDDDAQLEALDAALQGDLIEAVEQWVVAHGKDWISKGRASRLWRLLSSHRGGRDRGSIHAELLLNWTFRAACAAASLESLQWVTSQPQPPSSSPRLKHWLEAHVLRGGFDRVVAATEGAQGLGPEHALLRARALTATGRLEEAASLLEKLVVEDEATACLRDAHLSKTLMLMGEYARATALSRGIQAKRDQLPQGARVAVDFERAMVELTLGNRAMAPPFDVPGGASVGKDRATLMTAVHALLGLKLSRAEGLLKTLGPLASPFDQSWRYLIRGVLHALRGRELEAQTALTAGLEEARTHEIWTIYPWIVVLREAIEGLLDGLWPTVPESSSVSMMPLVDGMRSLSRYARAINYRPDDPQSWPPEPPQAGRASRDSTATTLLELAWTRIHFMRGEVEQADLFCTTSLGRAAQSGWSLLEQLGRMARLPVVVALGHRDAVETTLRELTQACDDDTHHVIRDWARLWRAVANPMPDMATVFQLAQHGSPPTKSLARALLVNAPAPSGYRRACIDAIRGSWTRASLRVIRQHSEDYGPGWVMDLVRSRVTSPASEELDFRRSKLGLRILTTIAASSHAVDKEQLAVSVWELSTYDPRRDDNRLHVALNRLRKFMAQLPGAEDLLQTGPDGYFLSAPQPIAVLLPIPQGPEA